MSPKEILTLLMVQAVPERSDEIWALWKKYNPDVELAKDTKSIALKASKERIIFDVKTMDVFWLIGFSGWRAIECYTPHVVLSPVTGQTITNLLNQDVDLADVERAYKERRAAAQSLIDAVDPVLVPWPPDLPRPTADRDALDNCQNKTAFDLVCMAAAFAFFHEFRHVMLEHDEIRHKDRREEELACDVWAREFMTSNLAAYAREHGHDYYEVLQKRSMGFAIAALILHEITPVWGHGGNAEYFSISDRLHALLDNTQLPEDSHFWNFSASLLIGIFRQRGMPIDAPVMNARQLTCYLLGKL